MFSRRSPRMNRRGIGGAGSAAGFLPTSVGGGSLLLWLRADQGLTLSNASVDPDMTTWALTLCTRTTGQTDPAGGTSAVSLTDSNDVGAQLHFALKAPTNMQSGPAIFDRWLKPGTKTWLGIQTASSVVYLDLTNGVLGTTGAGWSGGVIQTSGAWRRWRLYNSAASSNDVFYIANGDNVASYQGDGTGTVFIGTGGTYGPADTQNRVSQWSDQSGRGNHATQGTASTQMLLRCYDSGGNWVPYPGVNYDIGWPADASKNMTLAAAFKTAFTGNGIPMTVLDLRNVVAVPSGNNLGGIYLSSPVNGTQLLDNYNTPAKLVSMHTDDGSVQKTQTSTTGYATAQYKSLAFTYNGTQGNIFQNGVADASNPTDLDVGIETPANGFVCIHSAVRREIAVYNSVLSASDRKQVENGMRARWGLPLL